MENANDDSNNDTSTECALSVEYKLLVNPNHDQEISSTAQILENNMTPSQDSTCVVQTQDVIGKCTKVGDNLNCEAETNNNDSGEFPCCECIPGSEDIQNGEVEEDISITPSKPLPGTPAPSEDNINNSNQVSENEQKSDKNTNNVTLLNGWNHEDLSPSDTSKCLNKVGTSSPTTNTEADDTNNACSLALLNNIHAKNASTDLVDPGTSPRRGVLNDSVAFTTPTTTDLVDNTECQSPNSPNLDHYSSLFKKCSNYKKLPNEYVNHNIRRNKLLFNWISPECVQLEWNILDQVSPADWIGLYHLGK